MRYLLILEDVWPNEEAFLGNPAASTGRRLASVQKHAGKRGLRVLLNASPLPEGLTVEQVWERIVKGEDHDSGAAAAGS